MAAQAFDPHGRLAWNGLGPLGWTLALAGVLTALRVVLLFASPLELYPDEAQYWVWSRRLAFGYFSKPPMIAWLIRATTAVGGHGEPWVRLSAPLVHGAAALALQRVGRRLYGGWTGTLAAAIYLLMPGVALSSAVAATDSPLMLCAALALWAYSALWTEAGRPPAEAGLPPTRRGEAAALGFGLALGAAMLSKYAALYLIAGALIHAATSPRARRMWSWRRLALASATLIALAAPNVAWNAHHHFATVAHIAQNANWRADRQRLGWFDPRGGLGFVAGQLGVFGPVPFALLAGGTGALALRRALGPREGLLVAFAAPPLAVVLLEAAFVRANANWAAVAYVPGAVLTAALAVRWRLRRVLASGMALQVAAAAVIAAAILAPEVVVRIAPVAALRRARGWEATSRAVAAAARSSGPLSAEAVDDRFLFNAVAYYARSADARPAGALPAPWRVWVREARPRSQGALEQPLTTAFGSRVLAVNAIAPYRRAFTGDFRAREPGALDVSVRLGRAETRDVRLFVGRDFAPQPRDPRTGLPPGS